MYGKCDLRLEEFELPEIKQDEILAKVKAAQGKPAPKSKWQLRLEEAQKMQQQQLKAQQQQNRRK